LVSLPSRHIIPFRDITIQHKQAHLKLQDGHNVVTYLATYNRAALTLNLAATLLSGGAMMISKLYFEEDGQTLVEYGLLISLLALAVIAAVTLFGKRTANMWGNNSNKYPEPPT
jgi:pilus assembly protein Flp/PilA